MGVCPVNRLSADKLVIINPALLIQLYPSEKCQPGPAQALWPGQFFATKCQASPLSTLYANRAAVKSCRAVAEANLATAKGSRLAANASVAVAKARSAQASTGE